MADFAATFHDLDGYHCTKNDEPCNIETSLLHFTATMQGIIAEIPAGLGEGATVYYKMRAFKNPFGTGFVSWVVTTNPDPNGDSAPDTIVPGSAVIMASWIG